MIPKEIIVGGYYYAKIKRGYRNFTPALVRVTKIEKRLRKWSPFPGSTKIELYSNTFYLVRVISPRSKFSRLDLVVKTSNSFIERIDL